MASIDKRVVEMKFDNAAFERGVSNTMSTLDKLKSKLNFDGATKGLTGLSSAGKNLDLSGIGAGVDSLAAKFTNLGVIGVAALGTIASKATSAGLALANSLTLGPISAGFSDYNAKLTSVQTIMSATGKTIGEVDGYFRQLDEYADKTVFNLSDMTSALAKFTNAGVDLKLSVPAIKGIANMTALAGQGAESASVAFYNLSQSIAGGFLTTTDYKSLNLANVATKEWKDQMIAGALAAGTLKKNSQGIYTIPGAKGAYTDAALFTEALSEGWASAEVLTTVLGDYGDATTAIGKKAQAAAQNVKSFPMMMETLRAAVGTQWTDTFELLLGNVTESTVLFTGMTEALSKLIGASGDARNKLLTDFKALGGRTAVIESVKNAFNALGSVVKPIRDAFRELFPATTGKQLADLAKRLQEFTAGLSVGGETAQRIKSTFEGVFSILKIGVMIVSGITKAFFGIFATVGEGSGTVLSFTAVLGEVIHTIENMLQKTGAIDKFFKALVSPLIIIKPLIGLISNLAEALSMFVTGDTDGAIRKIGDSFSVFGNAIGKIRDQFNAFTDGLSLGLGNLAKTLSQFSAKTLLSGNTVVASLTSGLASVLRFLSSFTSDARGALSSLISTLTGVTNEGKGFLAGFGGSGLTAVRAIIDGLVQAFQKLRDKIDFKADFGKLNVNADSAGQGLSILRAVGEKIASVFSAIGGAFSGALRSVAPFFSELNKFFTLLVSKMREYLQNLDGQDAVALLNTGFFIALYIALKKFLGNLSEIAGKFGDMVDNIGSVFSTLTDTLKTMQTNIRANIILKIAIAVGVLVASVIALSKVDGDGLKKALAALTVVFVQVGAIMLILTKYSPASFAASAGGLILLAIAIRILASAIGALGAMDPKVLIQGGIALGVMMVALAGMVLVLNTLVGIPAAAAGLLILSVALLALVAAIKVYSKLDWGTLTKGLAGMALTLVAIGLALRTMPMGMPAIAIGLVLISGALVVLAGVLAIIGSLPLKVLSKGLIGLALALGIIAIAANAMTGALPGAAALLVIAAALAILIPVITALGLIPFGVIAKGVLAMALILGVLVVAMYALSPVIGVFLIFAQAVALLGGAMLLAGAGFALFAAGLGVLVTLGAAGIAVIVAGIKVFLALLPGIAGQVGLAFIAFIKVIGDSAGAIVKAVVKLALEFIKAFDTLVPAIINSVGLFITAFIQEFQKRIPQVVVTGLIMIVQLLTAIRSKIGQITNLAIDIITIFIGTLQARLPQIIQSGVTFILSFIEGLASAIRGNKQRTGEAGADLAKAIVEGMISGIGSLLSSLKTAATKLGSAVVDAVKSFLGINSPSTVFIGIGKDLVQGFINGIGNLIGNLGSKASEAARGAMTAAKNGISTAADIGKTMMTNVVSGVGGAMGSFASKAKEAATGAISSARDGLSSAASVGTTMISNITNAVGNGASNLSTRAGSAISGAIGSARNNLSTAASVGSTLIGNIISAVGNAAGGLNSRAGAAISGAVSSARNALGNVEEIGRAMINGMIRGISDLAGTLANRVADAARGALNAAKKVLGIASPSKEFEKIGVYVNEGFVKGLTGSSDKVDTAYTAMTQLLSTAMKAADADIASAKNKQGDLTKKRLEDIKAIDLQTERIRVARLRLNELTSAKQKDTESIAAANLAVKGAEDRLRQLTAVRDADNRAIKANNVNLANAQSERTRAAAANKVLLTQLADERNALKNLAVEYDVYTDKLKTAESTLDAAIKTRDDYNKNLTDKYGALPDINKDTTLITYVGGLEKKIAETTEFSVAIQQLKDLGLNDAMYKELLAKGVDAFPFVQELLAGGQAAVTQMNVLGSALAARAKTLGDAASRSLYQAGVQSAQGLVDGLKSQMAAIQAQMAAIAALMLAAVKKPLKIKSPSRVFMEIGGFAAEGLAMGLKNSVGIVSDAASGLGDTAVGSLQNSLANLGSAVEGNVDMAPVIRPIMDLTGIEVSADKIGALLGKQKIDVDLAYTSARNASSSYRSSQELATVGAASSPSSSMTFVQNNNSPKALSSADIYRQTKNQLSVAKEARS